MADYKSLAERIRQTLAEGGNCELTTEEWRAVADLLERQAALRNVYAASGGVITREEIIDELKGIFPELVDHGEYAVSYLTADDAISKASVFEILGNLMSIPYDFDRPITERDVSKSMDKIRDLPPVQSMALEIIDKYTAERKDGERE